MGKKEEQEMHRDERIEQTGQLTLTDNKEETSIHLLTIIGEIEGHDNLGSSSKTTKYPIPPTIIKVVATILTIGSNL